MAKPTPDETKCETCQVNPRTEPHTCPFAEEIHSDDHLCTCCSSCEEECAMDI